jgi:HSP20 family protein
MFEEDIFDELLRMKRRIEISETENEVIVRADLPGFSKEEVSVNATENTLTIEAKRKEKKEEKGERFYRIERKIGSLRRTVSLPVEIDAERAKAKMKDGVLEIVLPKKEKRKGKEIEIA